MSKNLSSNQTNESEIIKASAFEILHRAFLSGHIKFPPIIFSGQIVVTHNDETESVCSTIQGENHLTSKDFDTNSIYINPNAKVQQ